MPSTTDSPSGPWINWSRLRSWASKAVKDPAGDRSISDDPSPPANPYKIKPGYIERESPQYFEDVPDGVTYQPDVYELAGTLAGFVGASHLVDLGCGFGEKLVTVARRHGLRPIGIDHGKNLLHCREAYPEGQWIETNFENPAPSLLSEDLLRRSVIVSSDLIEHLKDPAPFVSVLRNWLQFANLAVLSTPERDVRWGTDHNGPPPNPHHIREWNAEELRSFLMKMGVTVNFVGLTRTKNTSYAMWTTLALLGQTKSVSAGPAETA